MPTVLRVFPIPSVYNFFIAFWPPTFMALPLLNAIARSTLLGREGRGVLLWTGVVGVLACSRVGWMAFSCVLRFDVHFGTSFDGVLMC